MPWDEDSDCCDWVSEHLENRLSLHFSLVSGSGDQATAIKLDQLVARAELNRSVHSGIVRGTRSTFKMSHFGITLALLGVFSV